MRGRAVGSASRRGGFAGDGVILVRRDGQNQRGPVGAFATETNPNRVAIADGNNDVAPDLVVANETTGTISVLIAICLP